MNYYQLNTVLRGCESIEKRLFLERTDNFVRLTTAKNEMYGDDTI